jgi:glycosyltransferase involved in cell wall biosynthesis
MDLVSIVIPTLNRPQCLRRALASIQAQSLPGDVAIEVLIIDNSADANQRAGLAPLCAADPRLRYVSEPVPGVATARNRGVAEAAGRWIAFLDDDEEAGTGWIADLVAVARRTRADAVFGPVVAQPENGAAMGALAPYFSRSIERADAADITDMAAYLGTNNSFFDRARCLDGAMPFETSLNETGGEDSLLLRRLVMAGRRFAWAPAAVVTEWAPERRLTWAYVRKRKFLSGQIRVFVHRMIRPVSWAGIVKWMAVGAVQFIAAGALALLLRPVDRERSEQLAATAAGGLGKVLWTPRFRPSMYGSGLVS